MDDIEHHRLQHDGSMRQVLALVLFPMQLSGP
jgi:hypothetical protein